jgi:hypothetical protein
MADDLLPGNVDSGLTGVKSVDAAPTGIVCEDWRGTIDGWVRDPAIRLDGLIALAMILGALVFVAGASPGTATTVFLSAGALSWWFRRRRRTLRQSANHGAPAQNGQAGLSKRCA